MTLSPKPHAVSSRGRAASAPSSRRGLRARRARCARDLRVRARAQAARPDPRGRASRARKAHARPRGRGARARIILAHSAVSDIGWIWRHLPDHPNIFIDTSWWNPVDLLALFAYAPPARILFASDAPYGVPALNAILTPGARCRRAFPGTDQVVAGDQLERLLAGEARSTPARRRDCRRAQPTSSSIGCSLTSSLRSVG